jgi:hypothetical protein
LYGKYDARTLNIGVAVEGEALPEDKARVLMVAHRGADGLLQHADRELVVFEKPEHKISVPIPEGSREGERKEGKKEGRKEVRKGVRKEGRKGGRKRGRKEVREVERKGGREEGRTYV